MYSHMQIQKRNQPWEYLQIDQVITPAIFSRIQKEMLLEPPPFKTLPDDPEEIQFTALPHFELTRHLLSIEFKSILENLTQEKLQIHQGGALQLRRMTSSSPEFPVHHDFIDQRALIMLYYISPQWSFEKGGELLLHKEEHSPPQDESTQWIAPTENRMILFFNNTDHWHSVRKVHNWTRYLVMAEWIVK